MELPANADQTALVLRQNFTGRLFPPRWQTQWAASCIILIVWPPHLLPFLCLYPRLCFLRVSCPGGRISGCPNGKCFGARDALIEHYIRTCLCSIGGLRFRAAHGEEPTFLVQKHCIAQNSWLAALDQLCCSVAINLHLKWSCCLSKGEKKGKNKKSLHTSPASECLRTCPAACLS